MRAWWSDARYFQIAALSTLLTINFVWIDFGARPLHSAMAIVAALATQAACARIFAVPRLDLRSALITGLSLSLLLRADEPWLPAVAGIIAIASKFVLRVDGKHVWNPAGFAIVALLAASDSVWISPGQWGTSVWLGALLAFLAILVLHAAQRTDIALFFLASDAALLLVRALWLGDPLAIPLHQLQSGSLLIFAFSRYMRHPAVIREACAAGEAYRAALPLRYKLEAQMLTDVTGWSQSDIEARMAANGQPVTGAK
jgi:Na+-transporting NADH:ubiquinone oxidoreductase subunit NqrB